jgi:hypothetical protein
MDSSRSELMNQISDRYAALVRWFAGLFANPASHRTAVITALVVGVVIALILIAGIALVPSKRKVVRKRRVRRVKRKVATPAAALTADTLEETIPEETPSSSTSSSARSSSRLRVALWALVWIAIVSLSFAITYSLTGSNRYCGETCHVGNPHVVLAIENRHADCVKCHESGPVSGALSRVRMALDQTIGNVKVVSAPVDSGRCLKCHDKVLSENVKTPAGLIVSHKEIVAGGYACEDCHEGIGHQQLSSIKGGMSRCTTCHDGRTAPRTCQTCHVDGSPLETSSPARKAYSSFLYGPAVRVANRDCARCHGTEKRCRTCHNGFVMPHPKAFIEGGHAPLAAFGAKDRCMKCHTIAWCGNGQCHNGFSAHDESTWPARHQTGTSKKCGSCHIAWQGRGSFCAMCH